MTKAKTRIRVMQGDKAVDHSVWINGEEIKIGKGGEEVEDIVLALLDNSNKTYEIVGSAGESAKQARAGDDAGGKSPAQPKQVHPATGDRKPESRKVVDQSATSKPAPKKPAPAKKPAA